MGADVAGATGNEDAHGAKRRRNTTGAARSRSAASPREPIEPCEPPSSRPAGPGGVRAGSGSRRVTGPRPTSAGRLAAWLSSSYRNKQTTSTKMEKKIQWNSTIFGKSIQAST